VALMFARFGPISKDYVCRLFANGYLHLSDNPFPRANRTSAGYFEIPSTLFFRSEVELAPA
jgi:hypothetical protein